MKRGRLVSWIILIVGMIYFFLPLVASTLFSLRAIRGRLSLAAYSGVFTDPAFLANLSYSLRWAVLTIVATSLLVVPTVYWVHYRAQRFRPIVEFITMMPFVVPAVVLAFGLIRVYSSRPLELVSSPILLIAAYAVLSLPYMFRAVDAGLRAIDVRTLTEAALSLGANWLTVIVRVIFPNLRVALLSGIFLTFAIVVGEYTFASLFGYGGRSLGVYMVDHFAFKAYESVALSVLSFGLTWGSIGIIQWIGRAAPGQAQVAGAH
jgi:putative spermidine/putrescine transport system permease protein